MCFILTLYRLVGIVPKINAEKVPINESLSNEMNIIVQSIDPGEGE